MKTKLEAGKEYWLDDSKAESGIFVGLDGKTLLFKQGKNCKSYGVNETGYLPFADIGREYCEVQEEKQWKFTTPIAMKCTEEQFNGIKDRLVEMGYRFYEITFGGKYRYLISNFAKDKRCITDLAIGSKYFKESNPIKFETFNPDLFLALAAMTDKEDGIKGEWWRYTDEVSSPIVAQKYLGEFTIPNRSWRKATAQEIIEHFDKKGITQCSHKTPVVGSIEYTVNVEFDSKKAAEELFAKIVEFLKSSQPEYKFIHEGWSINDKKEVVLEDKTIIPIPPSKQATLFDDRVEIADWKPKEGEMVYRIYVKLSGEIFYDNSRYDGYDWQIEAFKRGFIKRTESEAKQLVERLKQAML